MALNSRGFTIVELMVVAAVIAIMTTVAAFSALEMLPRYQLRSAARDFAGNLRLARKKAVQTGANVQVVFDEDGSTYNIGGRTFPHSGALESHYGGGVRFGFGRATQSAAATSSRLPASPVTFQGKPRRVQFNQRGLSNAGTVYFTNRRGDCCAVVVSTSGRIRMRTWNGTKWK